MGTPRRVADAYEYLFSGLSEDPTQHLEVGFAEDYGNVVIVRDIYLASVCEHHLLPFIGKVHLAYMPKDRVVGLSKLARVVEGYARRPQLQERLTAQIADAMYESLGSRGSLVVIEADHSCMTMRGVSEARQHHRYVGGPRRVRGRRRAPVRGIRLDPSRRIR